MTLPVISAAFRFEMPPAFDGRHIEVSERELFFCRRRDTPARLHA